MLPYLVKILHFLIFIPMRDYTLVYLHDYCSMKKIFLFSTLLIFAFSCKEEDTDSLISLEAKVIGEWEVYKFEKQELVQELVNGEIVQSMKWCDLTPSAEPEPSLIFKKTTNKRSY